MKRSLRVVRSPVIAAAVITSISAALTRDQALLSALLMSNWEGGTVTIRASQVRKQVQSGSNVPAVTQVVRNRTGLTLEASFSALCRRRHSSELEAQ